MTLPSHYWAYTLNNLIPLKVTVILGSWHPVCPKLKQIRIAFLKKDKENEITAYNIRNKQHQSTTWQFSES